MKKPCSQTISTRCTPELRAQAVGGEGRIHLRFSGTGQEFGERELERALIARTRIFWGHGWHVRLHGQPIPVGGGRQRVFIDLLLFHRRLRCLVAIELKVGEFLPEFVGKMQFIWRLWTGKSAR